MADTRTMSELLQAPTEVYGDAIVLPPILAENFELKVGLLTLVTSSQFYGFERDDPHSHIRWFNKITSRLKYKNVPHDAIKLMLFPFSLEGAARIWLEKEPPRSIHTWEDLVSKFVNYFFPPSKTTNLKNNITNFQQRFDETFKLHQIDTFYNALTQSNQDSLNAASGGNLLNCTPRDALTIIENKSKVRTSRKKPIVSKASATSSSTPAYLPEITALTDAVKAMLLQNKTPSPASVKAIDEICVTCGGPHPYYECLATDGNTFNASAAIGTYNQGCPGYRPQGETNYHASNQMSPPGFPQPNVQNNQNRYNQNHFNQGNQNYQAPFNQTHVGPSNDFSNYMKTNDVNMRAMQNQITNIKAEFKNKVQTTMRNQSNELKNDIKNMMSNFFQMNSPSGSGSLPSNTNANPRGDLKAITTRSGVTYDGLMILPTSSPLPKEVEHELEETKDKLQTTSSACTAHVQPPVVQVPIPEPDVAPKPNPKPSIPYPSRLNDQKLREKANNQMLKFLQIFQRLHFDFSFVDALLHIPKFASTFKSLLSNKEKLFELANTPLNGNCSAMLLKKLPEKHGDPEKFLIPCDFPKLVESLALADLGASINLMPLSVGKKLSLPELTHTRMTLKLVNRSVAYPVGVAEDVIVKVGKFHFPADFVVVDYDVDPRVPLILGRPFLRTARALVDVFREELILRDGDEKLILYADNTSKHPQKHANELINMINFIDITCEDRFPEVLKKSTHPLSGNTTPLSNSPLSLTPFETSDSLLEEFADELTLLDLFPPGIGDADFDSEGDILLLEKLLNDDPSSPLPQKELIFEELKMMKYSVRNYCKQN
ncbi:reverse transcriptase domain-containing protein [Tanacetum coccineum]